MSIFPATDIVTDVARAADPTRLDMAMKRLSEASAASASNRGDFASVLDVTQTPPPRASGHGAPSRLPPSPMEPGAPSSRTESARTPASIAAQKFEAFILQTCLETILPKEDNASYGDAPAAGVWRSMMAEQLGAQIAKAGGIGIQRLLDRDHGFTAARVSHALLPSPRVHLS
jgi:hypothetical protein